MLDTESDGNKFLSEKLKKEGFECKKESKFYWYKERKKSEYLPANIVYNPTSFNGELIPYQLEDVQKLINQNRCLITHDVGLGKTIMALAAISYLQLGNKEKKKILIVCPKSIQIQWCEEIQKFTTLSYGTFGDEIYKEHNGGIVRSGTFTSCLKFNDAEIQIITYGRLRADVEDLTVEEYFAVIYDECNNLKNIRSKQSRASYLVKSQFKYLLSATPIKSSPLEVFSLFRSMDLDGYAFGSYGRFIKNFAIIARMPYAPKPIITGYNPDMLPQLVAILKSFSIGRKKNEVIDQLKTKFKLIEKERYLDMSPTQRSFYNSIEHKKNEMLAEHHELLKQYSGDYTALYNDIITEVIKEPEIKRKFLPLFMLSRLAACSPEVALNMKSTIKDILLPSIGGIEPDDGAKITEVYEILDEIGDDEKVIIYTNFSKVAEWIKNKLEVERELFITSGETKDNDIVIEQFRNSAGGILVTTSVNSQGKNLQFASNLIMFDSVFTYSEMVQIGGRIARIGQENIPTIFHLIVKNSSDEVMVDFVRKKKVFNDII
jgi:SNF2 family DNA or RNA helicase